MGTGGSRSATRRTGRGRSPPTRSVGVRLGYGPIPAGATLLPACVQGGPAAYPRPHGDGRHHHRHRCRARGHAGSAQRLVRQAVSGRNPRPAQAREQVVRQHHGRPDAPAGLGRSVGRRGMNTAAVTCRPRGDHLAGGHHIRPRFRRALPNAADHWCTSSPLQRIARRCVRGGLQDADRPGRAGAPLVRVRSALPVWSVGFGARAVHAVVLTRGRTVAGEQGRPGSDHGYQGGHTWQTRTAADGCVRRVTGWFPVTVSELHRRTRLPGLLLVKRVLSRSRPDRSGT